MAEYSDRSFALGSFLKQTVPNAAENFLGDPGENGRKLRWVLPGSIGGKLVPLAANPLDAESLSEPGTKARLGQLLPPS